MDAEAETWAREIERVRLFQQDVPARAGALRLESGVFLGEVVQRFRRSGLVHTKRVRLTEYRHVFRASQLVDWLAAREEELRQYDAYALPEEAKELSGRAWAAQVGRRLLDADCITPADGATAFADDKKLFNLVGDADEIPVPPPGVRYHLRSSLVTLREGARGGAGDERQAGAGPQATVVGGAAGAASDRTDGTVSASGSSIGISSMNRQPGDRAAAEASRSVAGGPVLLRGVDGALVPCHLAVCSTTGTLCLARHPLMRPRHAPSHQARDEVEHRYDVRKIYKKFEGESRALYALGEYEGQFALGKRVFKEVLSLPSWDALELPEKRVLLGAYMDAKQLVADGKQEDASWVLQRSIEEYLEDVAYRPLAVLNLRAATYAFTSERYVPDEAPDEVRSLLSSAACSAAAAERRRLREAAAAASGGASSGVSSPRQKPTSPPPGVRRAESWEPEDTLPLYQLHLSLGKRSGGDGGGGGGAAGDDDDADGGGDGGGDAAKHSTSSHSGGLSVVFSTEAQRDAWVAALTKAGLSYKSDRRRVGLGDTDDKRTKANPLPIEVVLATPQFRHALQVYLERQLAAESIYFLNAVEAYRELAAGSSPERLLETARRLVKLFIANSGDFCVNIRSDMQKVVEAAVKRGEADARLFDEAAGEVTKMLRTDVFRRFVGSSEYTAMVKKSAAPPPSSPTASRRSSRRNSSKRWSGRSSGSGGGGGDDDDAADDEDTAAGGAAMFGGGDSGTHLHGNHKKLCTHSRRMSCSALPCVENVPSLLALARRMRQAGLLCTVKHRFKRHRAVLVGSTVVDWLMASGMAGSRAMATTVGSRLVDAALLRPTSGGSGGESLVDSSSAFYRFTDTAFGVSAEAQAHHNNEHYLAPADAAAAATAEEAAAAEEAALLPEKVWSAGCARAAGGAAVPASAMAPAAVHSGRVYLRGVRLVPFHAEVVPREGGQPAQLLLYRSEESRRPSLAVVLDGKSDATLHVQLAAEPVAAYLEVHSGTTSDAGGPAQVVLRVDGDYPSWVVAIRSVCGVESAVKGPSADAAMAVIMAALSSAQGGGRSRRLSVVNATATSGGAATGTAGGGPGPATVVTSPTGESGSNDAGAGVTSLGLSLEV